MKFRTTDAGLGNEWQDDWRIVGRSKRTHDVEPLRQPIRRDFGCAAQAK